MHLRFAEPPASKLVSVSIRLDRRQVVVVATGELDMTSVDVLDQELRVLRQAGFDAFVIDLQGVTFMDSVGLRLMLALRNTAKRSGHRLALIPGPPQVQRLFDLTGTRPLFEWRPGRAGAA